MSDILRTAGLTSDTAFTITEHFLNSPGAKSLSDVCATYPYPPASSISSLVMEKAWEQD